jgi:hypothetical protein
VRIKNILKQHLISIDKLYPNAIKIFIPENNYGNEGSHMWNMIKKHPNTKVYRQKEGKDGVWKGPGIADDYQFTFNVKLKNQAIMFDNNFFTNSTDHNVESIKAQARQQLEQYHIELEEGKNGGLFDYFSKCFAGRGLGHHPNHEPDHPGEPAKGDQNL